MISKLPNVGTTIFTEMSSLARAHSAINLSQGFPNYEPDQKLRDLVSHHMNHGKNQYPHMYGEVSLRERIAAKNYKMHGVTVHPDEEVNITAGGTQAIFTSIITFVHAGDEVIVLEPAFDCYLPAIELVGAKAISYEMAAPEFTVDWDEVEALITSKTSMIIVNTPHNPTGSILTEHDFSELARITRNTDIIILSDEVYEHLIFDDETHYTVLNNDELRERSIAVTSFGKTFHCTGWKVGAVVMAPRLMKEFRKVHQFNVFTVNSFVQHGISDYLEDPNTYLQLPAFYEEKRDLLYAALQKSRFRPIQSKGSYFILADYSEISDVPDREFVKWMTVEHGLASIPISVFYQSGKQDHLIRFCFAKTKDVLNEAAEIITSL